MTVLLIASGIIFMMSLWWGSRRAVTRVEKLIKSPVLGLVVALMFVLAIFNIGVGLILLVLKQWNVPWSVGLAAGPLAVSAVFVIFALLGDCDPIDDGELEHTALRPPSRVARESANSASSQSKKVLRRKAR